MSDNQAPRHAHSPGFLQEAYLLLASRRRYTRAARRYNGLSERLKEAFYAVWCLVDKGRMLSWKRLRIADPMDALQELYGP